MRVTLTLLVSGKSALGLLSADAHTKLEQQIVEVKRMLASLLLKVRAER
jgi:hypothetical protein